MLVPVEISNKVGKSEITLDSFDVDHIKSWICKKMFLKEQEYRMFFHLVPSFKIELIHDQKEVQKPTEEPQSKESLKDLVVKPKKSLWDRRKKLKNKRSQAKALAERKALELIEREKKRKEEAKRRAKEAEETKKKFHQKQPEVKLPTMLELVTAKLENVEPSQRLVSNPNLGFALKPKVVDKIKKLHDLLHTANLVSKNSTGKIVSLADNATAEQCINFVRELGEE